MSQQQSINTTATTTTTTTPNASLDVLPKQFVASMRILFNVLDDQNTGYVNLIDIETGWQDDGSKGLPHGVIDSLRKVTPANGRLTFERFCAGLKICLLRNQISNQEQQKNHRQILLNKNNDKIRRLSNDNILRSNEFSSSSINHQPIRPPSAPLLEIENPIIPTNQWNNMATVRPNNATILKAQRALSLPQLSPDSDDIDTINSESDFLLHNRHRHLQLHHPNLYIGGTSSSTSPPPKPPRMNMLNSISSTNGNGNNNNVAGLNTNGICGIGNNNNNSGGGMVDKAEIRHALQNWQMGILMNEMDSKDRKKSSFNNSSVNYNCSPLRETSNGSDSLKYLQSSQSTGFPKKPINVKRREPRRHTLQNGIDYNLLKRLKQFEGERDILLQGLSAVENAREWYIQQLSNVQEKMKYLGRMGSHVAQWSEVHQERLDFQRARILEINRNLSTLSDIPMLHMNLAVRPHGSLRIDTSSQQESLSTLSPPLPPPPLVERFQPSSAGQQQQNRLLIEDKSKKLSDRIAMFDCDNKNHGGNRGAQIGVQLPQNLVHSDVIF